MMIYGSIKINLNIPRSISNFARTEVFKKKKIDKDRSKKKRIR